nr:MAG TPA: hypothetical protein [Caudoviricetes sp.]
MVLPSVAESNREFQERLVVAVSVQNIIDILLGSGVILLSASLLVTIHRLRLVSGRLDSCERELRKWVPQYRSVVIHPEPGVDVLMRVGPCPRANDEDSDDSVSIRLRPPVASSSDDGIGRRLIRLLESLERRYGPRSLETLTSEVERSCRDRRGQ